MLLSAFKQAATEIAGRDLTDVCEATRLSELAIDSLEVLEVLGCLERRLDIAAIPDERLAGLSTVGDLLNVVRAQFA
jgi:acyl carrier protein